MHVGSVLAYQVYSSVRAPRVCAFTQQYSSIIHGSKRKVNGLSYYYGAG